MRALVVRKHHPECSLEVPTLHRPRLQVCTYHGGNVVAVPVAA